MADANIVDVDDAGAAGLRVVAVAQTDGDADDAGWIHRAKVTERNRPFLPLGCQSRWACRLSRKGEAYGSWGRPS